MHLRCFYIGIGTHCKTIGRFSLIGIAPVSQIKEINGRNEVFFITFSLIFLVVIGIIAFLTFIVPAFMNKKISYGILRLLVMHWLLFLTGVYTLLPTNIADAIFMPVWLVLCVAGALTAIYEFENNKGFAIPVAGLTTIRLLFSIFINGSSKM